jgi:hypothetical protein
MKAQIKAQFIALMAGLLFATAGFADTIADWTFETSQPATAGPFDPEVGAGSASGSHASASVGYSSTAGNGSAHSYSSNRWGVDDYYQFKVSSTGEQDLMLSFDQTSSNTGPKDFQLAYSTDGSNFTDFGSAYSVTAVTWISESYDLSSITALNNQGSVYFRLSDASTVSANGSTVGIAGTDRVDNVMITGSAPLAVVPTPPAFLAGLALLSLLALWRLQAVCRA